MISVRRARTSDVRAIRALVAPLADARVLVAKEAVAYYESLPDFRVAEDAGGRDGAGSPGLLGCGALHVMWEDLAEVRTVAVVPAAHGQGIGSSLLERLVQHARELGVRRLFCLTFETDFFARHGFVPVDEVPVELPVQAELLRSPDEGVAEFLDLERVKPNTLGNTRMLALL